MVLGAALEFISTIILSPEDAKEFSGYIKMLATVFIRLVQMIISPLVFTTLVVGIAKLGDIKSVGRIGGKAMLWFFSASLVSLLIGMFWVNLLAAGHRTQPFGCRFVGCSRSHRKNTRFFSAEFHRTHHPEKYC